MADIHPTDQDLTVRGEAIERVYGIYLDERYYVNRRYQRKLIWTLAEKISFIDSILRGYPVPIILLAESRTQGQGGFELIDGMQRLNAVMSFIENEYAVDGHFFDLNSTARTKEMLDSGRLIQSQPVMDREWCVRIAAYQLPFSIYEFTQSSNVDEVFRRINSGGRQLSRQELRAAGALGQFADVVRRIAIRVRGDSSHSDVLKLNDMKRISVTNRDLPYGIDVDHVFWVQEGILTKDEVRQSRDEEQIADIVAYMVSDEPVSSRAEFLDDYFGLTENVTSFTRFENIEQQVQRRTPTLVISDFQRTIDQISITLAHAGSTFGTLVFTEKQGRAPRYFQAIFLAFYTLIVRQNKEVKDRALLVSKMRNSADHIVIQEGGHWGAESRAKAIATAIGIYQDAFGDAVAQDPAVVHWVTQLQNILSQSYTEQGAYDFKQGFFRLDNQNSFDDDSFEKILKTCVGISNISKDARGYVLVGISDNSATTHRVEQITGEASRTYEGFSLVGVEREAKTAGKSLEEFFHWISKKLKSSKVSDDLKSYLSSHLKSVRYYEKTIFVFEVKAQRDPSTYDGKYYVRNGPQLNEVPGNEIANFIRRFDRGS